MDTENYSPLANKLLTYGVPPAFREWPNYLELGITKADVPELIRMIEDEDLNDSDSDSVEAWAPIHAWRTLGQLRAEQAIKPLLVQLHRIDDDEDDDWVNNEFPEVFSMIGPEAIAALGGYLESPLHDLFARICAANSLSKIGNCYEQSRKTCIEKLLKSLKNFNQNDPTLNVFLINYLVDLKATESLDVIREAYQHDYVDYSILGDVENAEIGLGVRVKRNTPPLQYQWVREEESFKEQMPAKKIKIGRNEPCPCGSGKKYKRCCGQ